MGAERLAEQGRLSHPNNSQPLLKMQQTEPQWEAVVLVDMGSHEKAARTVGAPPRVGRCAVRRHSRGMRSRPRSSAQHGCQWHPSVKFQLYGLWF